MKKSAKIILFIFVTLIIIIGLFVKFYPSNDNLNSNNEKISIDCIYSSEKIDLSNVSKVRIDEILYSEDECGVYIVEGYISHIHSCQSCVPNVDCGDCQSSIHLISVDPLYLEGNSEDSQPGLHVELEDTSEFIIGQKYSIAIKLSTNEYQKDNVRIVDYISLSD